MELHTKPVSISKHGKRKQLGLKYTIEGDNMTKEHWHDSDNMLLVQGIIETGIEYKVLECGTHITWDEKERLSKYMDNEYDKEDIDNKLKRFRKDNAKIYKTIRNKVSGLDGIPDRRIIWKHEDIDVLVNLYKNMIGNKKKLYKGSYMEIYKELGRKYSTNQIKDKLYSLKKSGRFEVVHTNKTKDKEGETIDSNKSELKQEKQEPKKQYVHDSNSLETRLVALENMIKAFGINIEDKDKTINININIQK